jgi:hypothetical protein
MSRKHPLSIGSSPQNRFDVKQRSCSGRSCGMDVDLATTNDEASTWTEASEPFVRLRASGDLPRMWTARNRRPQLMSGSPSVRQKSPSATGSITSTNYNYHLGSIVLVG